MEIIKISYDNHDEDDFYIFKWDYVIFNICNHYHIYNAAHYFIQKNTKLFMLKYYLC